jgi:hypothetical protein
MRDPRRRGGPGIRHLIRRREFIGASIGLALWPFVRPARATPLSLPPGTDQALVASSYVYVSPLRSDGSESSCHAEVWFGWFDDSVVLITGVDRWKSRSVKRGLDRARIWVGDYGRWKRLVGTNEAFRSGPTFDARAEIIRDEKQLDALLALYETKYVGEIAKWREPMRRGYADGSRVLLRYRPI